MITKKVLILTIEEATDLLLRRYVDMFSSDKEKFFQALKSGKMPIIKDLTNYEIAVSLKREIYKPDQDVDLALVEVEEGCYAVVMDLVF